MPCAAWFADATSTTTYSAGEDVADAVICGVLVGVGVTNMRSYTPDAIVS